ncbi:ATP-binding protein [Jidongwangia harbinensis]|uniref:ATP-binding protein n=1 Tax=Jidongwangia harbinensis TaxID=2878561 RepID=UPI001CD99AF3|nr:tetratricopeptide repeat protein [Jidongwangia harbinensis]MCA2217393.1 tetratricopeptide repeat protein [Jidongwangia harbinensis]
MFGDLVRAHRRRLSMTQEELAERAGVSLRSVGKWEGGQVAAPRPLTLRLLADALELTGTDRETFLRTASAPARPDAPAAPGPTPAQLPAGPAGFVGRDREIDALDARLEVTAGASGVPITVISGTAGVGKTALAVHWAHRVRDRFPDGQLYVNLRGFDPAGPPVKPAEALRGFLEAFDMPARRMPAGLEAQLGAYRSLLADRRVLIVLDNAADAEQVRPLLPGSSTSMVVVTSRNQLSGLVAAEGAYPLRLDLLSTAEAARVLGHRLGTHRLADDPAAVNEILARCASLPLALVIVAARAVLNPVVPLAHLARELRGAGDETDLDPLSGRDPATDVRAVLSWSYRSLSEVTAAVFRRLGLHPGPDITAAAASSLAQVSLRSARRAITELVESNLLAEHRPGRYVMHDVLRAYATELADAGHPETERQPAVRRLLDYYLANAVAATRLLEYRDSGLAMPTPAGETLRETLEDEAQAVAWLGDEERVLIAVTEAAARAGYDPYAVALSATLRRHLDRNARWSDMVTVLGIALEAAGRLGDRAARAFAHRAVGSAYVHLGLREEGYRHLRLGLQLCTELDDVDGMATAHRSLSWALCEEQRYQEALWHDRQALDLYRRIDNRSGEASALNGIGWLQIHLRAYRRAITSCRTALALFQLLGNRNGQAHTSDSLGLAHHHLGEVDQALDYFRRSLELFRLLGDPVQAGVILDHLGDTLYAAGRIEEARAAWQECVDINERLGQPVDDVRGRLDRLRHELGTGERPAS